MDAFGGTLSSRGMTKLTLILSGGIKNSCVLCINLEHDFFMIWYECSLKMINSPKKGWGTILYIVYWGDNNIVLHLVQKQMHWHNTNMYQDLKIIALITHIN